MFGFCSVGQLHRIGVGLDGYSSDLTYAVLACALAMDNGHAMAMTLFLLGVATPREST